MTDKERKEYLEGEHGLTARVLTAGVIRLTDGDKTLDLYRSRYFEVDTKKRGDLTNQDEKIREYFNL